MTVHCVPLPRHLPRSCWPLGWRLVADGVPVTGPAAGSDIDERRGRRGRRTASQQCRQAGGNMSARRATRRRGRSGATGGCRRRPARRARPTRRAGRTTPRSTRSWSTAVARSGRTGAASSNVVGRSPAADLAVVIERILAPLGRRLDRTTPIVDARLGDGTRVCAVVPPISVDGTILSLRRFRNRTAPADGVRRCAPSAMRSASSSSGAATP